jgi:signal transduction histidine kinase
VWSRFRSELVDWGMALALAAFGALQLGVFARCCDTGRVTLAGVLLTLMETLPVALRRRLPIATLALSGAAATAQVVIGSPVTDFGRLAVLIVFYTVATQSRQWLAIMVAALTPAGILAVGMSDRETPASELVILYVEFAAAWTLGYGARHRRCQAAERAARIEREAAAAERGRIARELHDVVAHGLSLITIHAAAAGSVMGTAPDRARDCLLAIETLSRQAWAEMRQFLEVVDREDASAGDRPGLSHLAELIERFEGAGLSVDVVVDGEARPLPQAADLAAYRVVQESLTNALRHGGPAHAQVSIGYHPGSVELEIANEGRRAAAAVAGAHRGLVGMRERVGLAGGELSIVEEANRFTVRARLPLRSAVEP